MTPLGTGRPWPRPRTLRRLKRSTHERKGTCSCCLERGGRSWDEKGENRGVPGTVGICLDESFATIASRFAKLTCCEGENLPVFNYSRLPTARCYHGAGESVAAHGLWSVEGRAARVQTKRESSACLPGAVE